MGSEPGFNTALSVYPEPDQNEQLLRYRTAFPDSMWGHLAGLLQARPFPTAVDMSCAMPGAAGAELAQWGFRVAEVAPPGQGPPWAHAPRLPPGCSDLVTVLPGPPSMAAAELLAEARRLMAKGGYLAVAWNDRDLSSPFVCGLEALLEAVNPDYCRASRQHDPPAWTNALTDGGALRLVSFSNHPHGLAMPRCGALQDLLGGLACVRAHLAASSATRKHFHREVARLVQQHFGEARPFELPLVSKLYVLRSQPAAAAVAAHCGGGSATDSGSGSSSGCGRCGGEDVSDDEGQSMQALVRKRA
ncbi:hypothetical protein OEZ86_010091 [Tetradesmus obliquus]|uniref:Methyltransferase type 11 domain-containing protein n=1 Tax=Tetradesmus obliquus TaxID=3088 RepID=A0ABY8UP40_TETOB|nr:hypothetical protein OEZ85_001525 [Tetradesmus obliquus]WIA43652.1 hypothetical protein OEZ86_010091 [Tetradesmus obliquus]